MSEEFVQDKLGRVSVIFSCAWGPSWSNASTNEADRRKRLFDPWLVRAIESVPQVPVEDTLRRPGITGVVTATNRDIGMRLWNEFGCHLANSPNMLSIFKLSPGHAFRIIGHSGHEYVHEFPFVQDGWMLPELLR